MQVLNSHNHEVRKKKIIAAKYLVSYCTESLPETIPISATVYRPWKTSLSRCYAHATRKLVPNPAKMNQLSSPCSLSGCSRGSCSLNLSGQLKDVWKFLCFSSEKQSTIPLSLLGFFLKNAETFPLMSSLIIGYICSTRENGVHVFLCRRKVERALGSLTSNGWPRRSCGLPWLPFFLYVMQ